MAHWRQPVGPEAEIERTICKEAKEEGWIVRKLAFLDCRGAPDRIFGRDGRCILIEFKRGDGAVPSTQQLRRHKELTEVFGLTVHVCTSIWFGRKLLKLRRGV